MILLGLGLYFQTYGDGASASAFYYNGNILMYNGDSIIFTNV